MRKAAFQQRAAQIGQLLFVCADIRLIEIARTWQSPDVPPVDILQRDRTARGRFAIALDGRNGALHRVVLAVQFADLPMQPLVFARQDDLNQRDILLAQHVADLPQAHAQLLHIGDHIQPRVLGNIVIAVPRIRVAIPGRKQPELIVQAQRRHSDAVHFCHFANGNQAVFHMDCSLKP